MKGSDAYKIRSDDPRDFQSEVNRVFEVIKDRLDRIEGFRGSPVFYATMEAKLDVTCTGTSRGLVLKDSESPPTYWRITAGNGVLIMTNLGREYE